MAPPLSVCLTFKLLVSLLFFPSLFFLGNLSDALSLIDLTFMCIFIGVELT